MVRKQVYITPEQEVTLKRLACDLGVTEAEIMRRGIDLAAKERELDSARQSRRIAWQALRQMMAERARLKPTVEGNRSWTREELYDERARYLSR